MLQNIYRIKDSKLDFTEIFANTNDVVLEIGFGMGGSLVEMALINPAKITLVLRFIKQWLVIFSMK